LWRSLLLGNPALGELIEAPAARAFTLGGARRALREARRTRADAALALQGLWKSAGWARLSGARRVVVYGRRWRREPSSAVLMSERVDPVPEPVHVIDKNLARLRALGIEAAEIGRAHVCTP